MIAHRLLKNSVPEDEYVLATHTSGPGILTEAGPRWREGEDTYPIIGKVRYSYEKLDRSLIHELITPPFVNEIDNLSFHL